MEYANPILHADFSDPDVIRVGEDFYMVSSSFTYLPGIPVLHSTDLVNWECVGHAAASLPYPRYDVPAHKRGTWAPSIRFHNGLFYVYVCLPDEGLLAFTSPAPEGPWECHIVKEVTGWIDPCPFWDENGDAYLLHGFAGSRAGIKNLLYLHRMTEDGLSVPDEGRLVYDGYDHGDTTTEGPKLLFSHGYYWIFCPAGGVTEGYQLALRSRCIYGPYERRIVLSKGDTDINGPHQGGLVSGPDGRDWFIHFQDRGGYGRVTHLQPVTWEDDWPVMGLKGSPVMTGETPYENRVVHPLSMSDPLRGKISNLWQYQANPRQEWHRETPDGLLLRAMPFPSLFEAGSFLSQTLLYRNCVLSVRVTGHLRPGDRAGIGMMGYSYTCLALETGGVRLIGGSASEISLCLPEHVQETSLFFLPLPDVREVTMIMTVHEGMYRYSLLSGGKSVSIPGEFPLVCGGWTGARPGIVCLNTAGITGGHAIFSDFIVKDTTEDAAGERHV